MFNVERETFNAYVERIEMFFTANNIVETTGEGSTQTNRVVADRKRAIFLTKVGPEVYSTLSNLLAPAKPKDTSFTDIVRVLENTTIRSRLKLHRASISVPEIKSRENQSAIMCLP